MDLRERARRNPIGTARVAVRAFLRSDWTREALAGLMVFNTVSYWAPWWVGLNAAMAMIWLVEAIHEVSPRRTLTITVKAADADA